MITAFEKVLRYGHELGENELIEEQKKLSALEKKCVAVREYISQTNYPSSRFNRNNMLVSIKFEGKIYYPIVGWDPDATSTSSGEEVTKKIPPMRRWLNSLPKRYLHDPKTDTTYIFYGV